ncbi:hypothetical protein AVEN_214072-1, partial [Araneus ventricosus]
RGGIVVRSRCQKVPGSKPDTTEYPPVWNMLHAKSYVMAKSSPQVWRGRLEKGVPAQVSSSHRVSKLRVPSQNSSFVASQCYITKLLPSLPRKENQFNR